MYQDPQYEADPLLAELKSHGDKVLPGMAAKLAETWRERGFRFADPDSIAQAVVERLESPDGMTKPYLNPDAAKPTSKHPLKDRLNQLVAQGGLKAEVAEEVFSTLVAEDPHKVTTTVGAARAAAEFLSRRDSGKFLAVSRPTPMVEVELAGAIITGFGEVPRDKVAALARYIADDGRRQFPDKFSMTRAIADSLRLVPVAERFGLAAPLSGDDERRKAKAPLAPKPVGAGNSHSKF